MLALLQGKTNEVTSFSRQAGEMVEKIFAANDPQTAQSFGSLAILYVYSEQQQQALDLARLALARKMAEAYALLEAVTLDNLQPQNTGQLGILRRFADAGKPHAQNSVGLAYQTGRGVPRDFKEALNWYHKAAAQGSPAGENNVGWMYKHGLGVNPDMQEAFRWFRKAALHGHAGGQNNLGAMYASGSGVKQDDTEALHWYRSSADQGHPPAIANLGQYYEEGWGVERDYGKAIELYFKASVAGYPLTYKHLGALYEKGHGVSQDVVQAYAWYSLATEQTELLEEQEPGSVQAVRGRLAALEIKLTPAQIAAARRRAEEWKSRQQ